MIQTSRLTIRSFEESDRDLLLEFLMDPGFMEYSLSGALSKEEAYRRFDEILAHSSKELGKLAIIENNSDQIIGYCGIEPFDLYGQRKLELGYRIAPQKRNFGFATEAAEAVAKSFSGELYAYVEIDNFVSIKVLEKIGFDNSGQITLYGKPVFLFESGCNKKMQPTPYGAS